MSLVLVTDLHPHPRADAVPWMDPDDHEALVDDIARRGIVVPLDVTPDGIVLDGRTRLAIARALGLADVPVRVVDPADPYEYMILAALRRRHLTASQKAMLARHLPQYATAKAEAAERERAGVAPDPSANVRQGPAQPPPAGKAAAVVAQVAGVSPRLVEQAEQVARVAPDLVPEVEQGRATVHEALKVATARIRETDPAAAEAHRGALFAKAMKAHGKALAALSADEWAEGLDASDVAVMLAHLVGIRQWSQAWEKALDRPALRVIGGPR